MAFIVLSTTRLRFQTVWISAHILQHVVQAEQSYDGPDYVLESSLTNWNHMLSSENIALMNYAQHFRHSSA